MVNVVNLGTLDEWICYVLIFYAQCLCMDLLIFCFYAYVMIFRFDQSKVNW